MPTNIDDINELLSKARPVSGASAQTPPSTSDESPVETAGDSNVEPAVLDPAKIPADLLEKMSAVLTSRKELDEANAANHIAKRLLQESVDRLNKGWLPATDDSELIDQALTALEALHFERARLQDSADHCAFERAFVLWRYDSACVALEECVDVALAEDSVRTSPVVLAAADLSGRVSSGEAKPPAERQAPSDLTEEQLASVNSMRKAAREATFAIARALKLIESVNNASAVLKKARDVDVVPPVRPTEEEIQRYLRQLEQAQGDRLHAEQTLLPLLTAKAALLEELNACETGLAAEREAVDSILEDGQFRIGITPHKWLADKIDSHFYSIKGQLGRAGSGFENLDGLRKPAQSKTEVRRLAEVRKHLRNLAITLAHFNEAKSSYEDVSESPRAGTVSLKDITIAGFTWQECVEWRRKKAEQQFENDRLDRSRQAKLDLLEKSVAKYLRDVGDAEDTLSRYLNLIEPAPERPDCDELRMLRRAANRAVADAEAVRPPKPEPDYDGY